MDQTLPMKKKELNKKFTSLDDILDKNYGKKGAPKREVWERRFEIFRLGVKQEEQHNKQNRAE